MTPTQLAALQSYVSATVRVMTEHAGAHAQNARLFVDARKVLERAFGQTLPTDYPDLFGEVPAPKPPGIPDIL